MKYIIMLTIEGPPRMIESIEDWLENRLHEDFNGEIKVLDYS